MLIVLEVSGLHLSKFNTLISYTQTFLVVFSCVSKKTRHFALLKIITGIFCNTLTFYGQNNN